MRSECGNRISGVNCHSNYGPILLSFRDMTTGRTKGRTDGRTTYVPTSASIALSGSQSGPAIMLLALNDPKYVVLDSAVLS